MRKRPTDRPARRSRRLLRRGSRPASGRGVERQWAARTMRTPAPSRRHSVFPRTCCDVQGGLIAPHFNLIIGWTVTTDSNICRLNEKPCSHLRRFGHPCSENPTLEDAGRCIALLTEERDALEIDLGHTTGWVERLQKQLARLSPKSGDK